MDSFRDEVIKLTQKYHEWASYIGINEGKDYHDTILDLSALSPKDQTTILKIRSTHLFSTMSGGLLSVTAAFWASTRTFLFPILFN
jgi:hypothetical protein